VDLCPAPCEVGNLDLSESAFVKIAGNASLGRVNITWQFVECAMTSPVSYKYKDGSSQYWTAVQVRNSRLPVQSLDWSKDSGATWTGTTRMDYNYFLDAVPGFGAGTTLVRITAIDGQVLEDTLPAVQALLVTQGHANFK
jgi:expansin (peptidoglycan-binding protein)